MTLGRRRWALLAAVLGLQCACQGDAPAVPRPVLRAYGADRFDAPEDVVARPQAAVLDTVVLPYAVFLVYDGPVFTEDHVAGVRRGDPGVLVVELDEVAAESLRSFTAAAVGRPLALRLGERWTNFPIVQAEIGAGEVFLLGLAPADVDATLSAFGSR